MNLHAKFKEICAVNGPKSNN